MIAEREERALLGACMAEDERTLELVTSTLPPEYFALDSHQRIAKGIIGLYASQRPVTIVTVGGELQKRHELETVGGQSYLCGLTEDLPGKLYESAKDHIERLKEAWRRRQIAILGEEIAQGAAGGSQDSHSLIQTAATRLEAIVSDSVDEDPAVQTFIVSSLDKWQREHDAEQSCGLSYGIADLDAATGGMRPGEQTALGASSGVGKTSALVQALHANCSQGIPCHAFLLEPTRDQVVRKLCSMVAGVRYGAVTDPRTANVVESDALRRAAGVIAEWPLFLHDRSTLTLDQVLGLGRLSINRHGTKLIALDYVQRLKIRQAERDEPLRLRVARASTALADLVKGTNCASLLLSQLTTGRKNGAQAKPTMYDFRESSQIENDAHTIILLHRTYDEDQGHYMSEGAIFVPKQRFGLPCNLAAWFDPKMAVWKGQRNV